MARFISLRVIGKILKLQTMSIMIQNRKNELAICFTMPSKNKKAQKEVTDYPSQYTPKQANLLNGEKLHTYLALCKREFETTKDAGFGLLKISWAKFHLTSRPKSKYSKENDAHKIYQGLNGENDFKRREAYKILAQKPRWDNLRDDGLNHAVNIPRNVVRRTSDNSSLGNSVGSNNLSEDPDGPLTPQSAGPNSDLDGSLYEGGSSPIGQKLYRKNLASQKPMEGVATSGSGIQIILDELRLEKIQAKEEEYKQYNTGKPKWIWSNQRKIAKSWSKT
ncbi:hypothetical protein GIB67_018141 [Kingdonia uniflora]|uniref:Uncharacterized protein n=1 Tax=Kingdonia uniflora TaxID=39325 RepID=A0A7J7NM45_9MAGN|nr:hypothetical protein GIB67_018141 [Kingdonia uniflora]